MTQLHNLFNWTTCVKTLWMYRVKQDWSGEENCSYNCNLTQCPIAIKKKKKKKSISVYSSFFLSLLIKKKKKKKSDFCNL